MQFCRNPFRKNSFDISTATPGRHNVQPRTPYPPRKIFSIPIRIRPLISESLSVAAGSIALRNAVTTSHAASSVATLASSAVATSKPVRVLDMQEGATLNLSERGIYFKTAQRR